MTRHFFKWPQGSEYPVLTLVSPNLRAMMFDGTMGSYIAIRDILGRCPHKQQRVFMEAGTPYTLSVWPSTGAKVASICLPGDLVIRFEDGRLTVAQFEDFKRLFPDLHLPPEKFRRELVTPQVDT